MIKGFIDLNRGLSRRFSNRFKNIVKSENYKEKLLSEIARFADKKPLTRILEAGGIDRPLLSKSEKVKYDGVDIESKPNCLQIYDDFYIQSIEEPLKEKYDVICSFTLLEHVRDNKRALYEMFVGLNSGGLMIHYVPSKYHPYSLVARMLGSEKSARLLHSVHPQTIGICGYPSYFHKCSVNEISKLCGEIGFKDIVTVPYYRANSYFEIFFPAYLLVTLWENLCRKLRWSLFCSGFILIATK